MRLLLCVLLVVLVTFLATIDAADSTKTSKLEAIEASAEAVRALFPEYVTDGKRSLRIRANDDATDDDELYMGENDDERAFSIASILDSMKASVGKLKDGMSAAMRKRLNDLVETKAMNLYKMGETPASLKIEYTRWWGADNGVAVYKAWYDKNVAAGVIKALD